MKTTLLILNILMLVAALIWLMIDKSFEPLITSLGLTAGLITIVYNSSNKDSDVNMKQKGGKNSTNYQAGGNINLNITNDKRQDP